MKIKVNEVNPLKLPSLPLVKRCQLAEISARTQSAVVRQENIERILTYLENPNRGDTMPN